MYAKYASGMNEVFVDTKHMPVMKKKVKPIDKQEAYDSRRLWRDVTKALKEKDTEAATDGKRFLEQRQVGVALNIVPTMYVPKLPNVSIALAQCLTSFVCSARGS